MGAFAIRHNKLHSQFRCAGRIASVGVELHGPLGEGRWRCVDLRIDLPGIANFLAGNGVGEVSRQALGFETMILFRSKTVFIGA